MASMSVSFVTQREPSSWRKAMFLGFYRGVGVVISKSQPWDSSQSEVYGIFVCSKFKVWPFWMSLGWKSLKDWRHCFLLFSSFFVLVGFTRKKRPLALCWILGWCLHWCLLWPVDRIRTLRRTWFSFPHPGSLHLSWGYFQPSPSDHAALVFDTFCWIFQECFMKAQAPLQALQRCGRQRVWQEQVDEQLGGSQGWFRRETTWNCPSALWKEIHVISNCIVTYIFAT